MGHMHWRWAAGAAICGVLAVGGCAAPGSAADPGVIVRDGANGHTVALKAGQRLEVILGSDYWTVQGSSAPRVLRQDGATTTLPTPSDCAARPPGMGCTPVRTDFSALAPGTAVVTASRMSCGEAMRCPPGMQHYSLTVVVRGT